MSEPEAPGVLIKAMSSIPREITGLPTSTAAVVGTFQSGPSNEPVTLESTLDLQENFGDPGFGAATSIAHFFLNGGNKCLAVRVTTEAGNHQMLRAVKRATRALEDAASFNLLCLPAASDVDKVAVGEVIAEAVDLCSRKRAFLLLDSPPAIKSPTDLLAWLKNNSALRHPNAALYFPWLKIVDTQNTLQTQAVPPSGAVAGLIARVDATRGVWKAPAGSEANLDGVSLEGSLSDHDSNLLNGNGVNSLRQFPDAGVVVWGARTLSSDPDWRYVNIRRLALYLEDSLDNGLQWTDFEPNNEQLWKVLRRAVEQFLYRLFIAGAFQGNKPEQAYFVKCDRTTMTQNDIDNGRCIALVGFAAVKPAEFVILRIVRATLT